MIDDSIRNCRDCIENNITTLLMDTPYNRTEKDIIRVNNWKEIYEFITNYKKEKANVILDTDTYNECDDQFAKVFKGSTGYICKGYNQNNDAVNKIIEVADKNEKTYILAI